MNKPITNARVTRCFLLLQEFDITIVYRPGKDNVFAYFLYRLNNNDDDSPVKDSFPNEHLIAVSTYSPWYPDIANYLVASRLPTHLSNERTEGSYNRVRDIFGSKVTSFT